MNRRLLSDQAVQDFIVNGYLILKPEKLTAAYHQDAYDQLTAMIASHGNPGNDLLAGAPYIQEVLEDPVITGALDSLIGPNHVLNRHCHCHDWGPGGSAQDWHKDYPLGGNMRYHRGRTLLLFYYPQKVSPDMGPTAIQPGTQYYKEASDLPGLNLCAEAGSVVITHYELWHRATANTSDRMRFMLKFLYNRTEEPNAPSWNNTKPHWQPAEHSLLPHRNLWQHMWHWYTGATDAIPYINGTPTDDEIAALKSPDPVKRRRATDRLGLYGAAAQTAVPALKKALTDTDEAVRLNAAYALGSVGENAVPILLQALEREAANTWNANLERGDYTNPSQLDMPYGLAAAGPSALPALCTALDHPDWFVRAAAIATLGCIGPAARAALPAMTTALADPNEWVARNAADALGNLVHPQCNAGQALIDTLADTRPVTAWSLGKDPLRENAAATLAKIGPLPQTLITPLQAAQENGSEYLRFWAKTALKKQENGS